MTTDGAQPGGNYQGESRSIIAGLCLIVASTLLVEVCLTKFVSYKVYYHFVYAIISTVILSAGFAGTAVHLWPQRWGRTNADPWNVASKSALYYAISLIVTTLIFCILPFDPFFISSRVFSPWTSIPLFLMGSAPVAAYFLLFAVPFFFAGICVSCTLAVSKRPVSTIYFFDLIAAAAGALLCPFIMENLGGYGTIIAAAALGMGAFYCFGRAAQKKETKPLPWLAFAGCATLMAGYPQFALSHNFLDIVSMKTAPMAYLFFTELNGVGKTYWNAVARIDISNTGTTTHFETPQVWAGQPSYTCRFVLVDGAAPTRQLRVDGDISKEKRLGEFIWAGPYATGAKIGRELVIGTGGGIDILVGKFFKVNHIDALEINPSTYKHVLLGQDDPDAALYQPGLRSTPQTEVVIHNTEARHFCTSMPDQSFDLVKASAVDTLTAITSGALAMVENYLYTSDAVKEYTRLLKPGGILSLTHWRTDPPATSIRMFVTYLNYLDSIGVDEPWRHIVVTGNNWWADEMMKTTPFTKEEVDNIKAWARANGHAVIFDPFRNPKETVVEGMRPSEAVYTILGFLKPQERRYVLSSYGQDIAPVSDNKPFFYQFGKEDFFVSSLYFSTPMAFVCVILIASYLLFSLPLKRMGEKARSTRLGAYARCFALAGFAFLLSELAIIQLFGIFVGGPIYSLAVVLVAVLCGYATGSLASSRLKPTKRVFQGLGVALAVLFLSLQNTLPALIHGLLGLGDTWRILFAFAVTYLTYILVGVPVSLALTAIKDEHEDVVSWMWGVSCASNAIAAMCFSLISQVTGISQTLFIAAVLYLLANLGFARQCAKTPGPQS